MSSIKPDYHTVKELLHSRSFSIDEYQREYKWDSKNIEELLSDLHNKFAQSYQDGDTPQAVGGYEEYFLGSIIVTKRNNRIYLVDGQQRTTSLTLLLIYLYRAAKEQGLDVAETMRPLIYSDNFGEKQFNIDIPERIPVVKALFEGEDYKVEDKEESVQNIYARYKDMEDFGLVESLGTALQSFIYWLMNKVGLIEISTDSDEHAYSIFETMNDRGKPLSPVDMLKAYLLAPITDAEDRRRANETWKTTIHNLISSGDDIDPERDSTFMKAWLRAKYAQSQRERKSGAADKDFELIGNSFHRWFRDNATRIDAGSPQNNLRLMTEEIPFFAHAYMRILEAEKSYVSGLEPYFTTDITISRSNALFSWLRSPPTMMLKLWAVKSLP